jgi:N-acetylglucosamine kinase-like BadF-type ATPase
MKYFLGIDQGGTKTETLVCDENGNITGRGYGSGLAGVYYSDSDELYLKRIREASEMACGAAGITIDAVDAACAGMNGADWDFEYPALRDRLSRALSHEDVIVLNDCVAAMRGGSADLECAVVCAGSGMNAAVRNADGREIIYGYYVNQRYQGASAIGEAGLLKVIDSSIGLCGETSLTGRVLSHTGHASAEQLLIDVSMGRYMPAHKEIAPYVMKSYAEGDSVAVEIIDSFSRGAARYITAGMKRLGLAGKPLDVVFSGGVFKGDGALAADRTFEYIVQSEPFARKVHARLEPVCGAALTLLDRHYRGTPPPGVIAAFNESAASLGLCRNPGRCPPSP